MAVWSNPDLLDTISFRRIDSEFFGPDFIRLESQISRCKTENLGSVGKFIPGPFGSAFRVQDYDFKSNYRYIRGRDVKPFFLLDDDSRYIPEADYMRLVKYSVKSNDLLISVVGTLGNVAVCTESESPAVFSCKSTIFRSRSANPLYLLAFFNSLYGRNCLLRRQRGAIQAGLNIEDLRSIPIPRFGCSFENDVGLLVSSAYENAKSSKTLFEDAQRMLEEELFLDSIKFDKPMGYTARFSELEASHRSDAQHYQPRFAQLTSHLSKFPTRRIREVRRLNRRGIQPVYVEDGSHAVVNSQHLGAKHINYEGLQRTTERLFNASPEAHIHKDDLLIYTTGAYIGRANAYLDDKPAFASNHVNILRLSPDIDHAYMAMVFQSVIGQFQTLKHARGSAQAELYPADIDKFVVPLLPSEKQREIGDLVRESLAQQRQSARLLEQAKARVEQLIEEAVAA